MMDKATIRVFAEAIADQLEGMCGRLAQKDDSDLGQKGRAISFVAYGVAWALADPGVARMVCTSAIGDQPFERMQAASEGISHVIREHAEMS